jgi:transketolase
MASKWQAATFNRPGFELFDFNVYAICGDGCLQEGISHEAASLAGHLKLDNLCWIWDNNQISIEGNTSLAITEDLTTRFIAYGWNVLRVGDANDVDALTRAIRGFKREAQRPTFIVVDSHIAWGAPTKQDTACAHGAPLGEAEISAAKKTYGWPDEKFLVPEEFVTHFQEQLGKRGGVSRRRWDELFTAYSRQYPDLAQMVEHIQNGTLPEDWDKHCTEFAVDPKGLATRQSSSDCLNMVGRGIPWLLGGSADLAPSCLTQLKFDGANDFMPPSSGWGTFAGRNLHFGIREHAMGSILNGLAASGLRPFASTFLVFSDYMKPPVRLSAISELPCIWIFTHDSIGVGEDGPTHQPIEQLAACRSVPGLLTFRPCDANETLEAWKYVIPLRRTPAAFVLSRQALPTLDRKKYASAVGVHRGAYVLADSAHGEPDLILMATGSEVTLILEAHEALAARGVRVRSVSVPCLELFKQQPQEYIRSVLPDTCRARVSVEAGTRDTWGDLIGLDGEHIGMSTFGESGPGKQVQRKFGFTVEAVITASRRVMLAADMTLFHARKRRRVMSDHKMKGCE